MEEIFQIDILTRAEVHDGKRLFFTTALRGIYAGKGVQSVFAYKNQTHFTPAGSVRGRLLWRPMSARRTCICRICYHSAAFCVLGVYQSNSQYEPDSIALHPIGKGLAGPFICVFVGPLCSRTLNKGTPRYTLHELGEYTHYLSGG